jgi:transposase
VANLAAGRHGTGPSGRHLLTSERAPPTLNHEHVAKPLTDDERQQIIDLCEQGRSCRDIAAQVGRSHDTVSRIAKEIGHRFGRTNLSRAQEARSAYSAEKRAELAARATERAQEVLERMSGPYLVFNFGGRDNTYEEHTLEEPPTEAVRAMAQTFRDLMRTVLDVDRHDNRNDEGLAAVDQWLRDIVGGSE